MGPHKPPRGFGAQPRLKMTPLTEFRLTRRVQFYETDAAGIVHFSVFFRYLEEAEHAMWRAAGLSIAAPGAPIGFPRVATSFDFLKPLRFEDEFDVWLRVTGKTPKTLSYSATVEKDGTTVARGSLTIACVRKRPGEPMRGTEIPADIADRFAVAPVKPNGQDGADH
ncbi:MAG: 4-hydroxybenzoyl-CoA thioesterase [Acidobacteria bacterium]|nr:4-hydroxybenzoyl-CoA thioesterase [Acidobacteriota bacterium]